MRDDKFSPFLIKSAVVSMVYLNIYLLICYECLSYVHAMVFLLTQTCSTVFHLGNISWKKKKVRVLISDFPFTLPIDIQVLVNMHQIVIPFSSNPAMLCDFLTRSYDIGGVVSVMALSVLFILMTNYWRPV